MQAVLPVAAALAGRLAEDVRHAVAPPAAELLRERGHAYHLLDAAFYAEPEAAIGRLLAELRPKLVLLGASPARGRAPETPEQFATLVARRLGVPSLAVLDYWGMYEERFVGDAPGEVDLALVPDRICVLDTLCREDLIALGMPAERMVVTHNPWLDDVVANAARRSRASVSETPTLIFASQPLAEYAAARGWAVTQNQLFEMLIECAQHLGAWRLVVWPHKAEEPRRWPREWREQRGSIEVEVRRNGGSAELAEAAALATSHSTTAYEALHMGVPCLSLCFDMQREPDYVIDRIGISESASTREDVVLRLKDIASGAARARLAQRKKELSARGIFFSDGRATERVLSEVLTLAQRAHR